MEKPHCELTTELSYSGLLVAYVVLKGSPKIHWGQYYFHRMWRLTPSYAAVILFTMFLPLLGSGPTWKHDVNSITENCKTSWWNGLLYISNFFRVDTVCLSHGWYVAMDTQFYFVAPLILIAFRKNPVWGLLVNSAFLITSVVTPAVLGAVNHYLPTILPFEGFERYSAFFHDIYIMPYCRMGPYCVGIFVGYFLANQKSLNLSRLTKTVVWCLSIASNLFILFCTFEWHKGHASSNAVNTFYMATHRTAWALGVAWVVVACATGNGGVVNSILSWKVFVPLGRVTYMAYLIHTLLILVYGGLLRDTIIYAHYTHITLVLGLMIMTYGYAMVAFLAIESPFLNLEKLLFAVKKKPDVKDCL